VDTPKKPSAIVIGFPNAQAAIDGLLTAWLPCVIKSNDLLTTAMVKLKKRCLDGAPSEFADQVLEEVEGALEAANFLMK
jgi:hypothetical protein